MKRNALLSGLLAALVLGLLFPRAAMGTTVQLTLTDFTGDDALVIITLDDAGGVIAGDVDVQANPNIGDLRAIFLQVFEDKEFILPGLNITGDFISATSIGNDDVVEVGNANVNGGGSPGPFDIGIAFGTPGIGSDDIQSAAFLIAHSTNPLTLDMFDFERWAARLTSVGLIDGLREGSSKLSVTGIQLTGLEPPPTPSGGGDPTPGIAPIPEPGTLALGAVAAMFTSGWWWRRRAAARRLA